MATLIESWRKVWSVVSGTTDEKFPIGLVTLADATDEGRPQLMRGFRWAQTAGYGTAPNPVMENVFVAEGYDIGDPWNTPTCAANGCCVAATEKIGANCSGDHRGKRSRGR